MRNMLFTLFALTAIGIAGASGVDPIDLMLPFAALGILVAIPTTPQALAFAGTLYGSNHGHQADSATNNQASAAKIVDITITAVNDAVYTVTLNGIPISITADASATTAEIRDALIAAILAAIPANNLVLPANGGAAVLRLTERFPAVGEVTVAVGANLVAAVITAHGAGEPMPPGIAVAWGPTDNSCRLMVDADSRIRGVTIFDHSLAMPQLALAGDLFFAPNSVIALLRDGGIVVKVEEAVTPASPVYVRHTASGVNTQKGAFRASADTATAVAWTAAEYKTSAAAGGLAVLVVNLS